MDAKFYQFSEVRVLFGALQTNLVPPKELFWARTGIKVGTDEVEEAMLTI